MLEVWAHSFPSIVHTDVQINGTITGARSMQTMIHILHRLLALIQYGQTINPAATVDHLNVSCHYTPPTVGPWDVKITVTDATTVQDRTAYRHYRYRVGPISITLLPSACLHSRLIGRMYSSAFSRTRIRIGKPMCILLAFSIKATSR